MSRTRPMIRSGKRIPLGPLTHERNIHAQAVSIWFVEETRQFLGRAMVEPDGKRRQEVLGRHSEMAEAGAQTALSTILTPLNATHSRLSQTLTFGNFVRSVYLPFFRRKWKRTTTATNEDRIEHHLFPEFDPRGTKTFHREELQAFLDRKA